MEEVPKQVIEHASERHSDSGIALDKIDFKNRKFLIAIVAVVVIGIAIAAFVLLGQGKTDTGDGYVLSNQKIETVDGYKTVTATIKNTSGHVETFMVNWNVFDSNGERTGGVMGLSEELPDGGSARIEGLYLPDSEYSKYDVLSRGEEIDSFELDGVGLMKEENARLEAQIAALAG